MNLSLFLSKFEKFEWDKGNLEHIKKHKVNYNECEQVFSNKPLIILGDEKHSVYEERYKIFGKSNEGRYLALVITVREDKIRIVMARDQNKKERGDLKNV
ncbi:MAG: BrnT family toxin [Patescibacteria group bacterium]